MKILSSLLDVGVSDEKERHVPSNPCKMQNRLFMQKNLGETDIHNNHMTSQVVCSEMQVEEQDYYCVQL